MPIAMEFTLTVPSLLFSTISLLLLAFTNRFLTVASLIRQLHSSYKKDPHILVAGQISNLRNRIKIIRSMQALGIGSLFMSTFSMFLLFFGLEYQAKVVFGMALLFMIGSLGLSFWEIMISTQALELELSDMDLPQEHNSFSDLVSRVQQVPSKIADHLRHDTDKHDQPEDPHPLP